MELLRTQGLGATSGVVHAFTTRKGGGSHGAFATLNLGATVGDERSVITENRQRVLVALGKPAAAWVSVSPAR